MTRLNKVRIGFCVLSLLALCGVLIAFAAQDQPVRNVPGLDQKLLVQPA
jgi:hypothetical protein